MSTLLSVPLSVQLSIVSLSCLAQNILEEEEKYLISRSGIRGSILITTNLVGRGTDIPIGGDLSLFGFLSEENKQKIQEKILKDKQKIEELKGLHIILFDQFKDARIVLQAMGRTARQETTGTVIEFQNKLFFFSNFRIKNSLVIQALKTFLKGFFNDTKLFKCNWRIT